MTRLQTLTVAAGLLAGTALSAQAQELQFIMCGGEVRPDAGAPSPAEAAARLSHCVGLSGSSGALRPAEGRGEPGIIESDFEIIETTPLLRCGWEHSEGTALWAVVGCNRAVRLCQVPRTGCCAHCQERLKCRLTRRWGQWWGPVVKSDSSAV